MKVRYDRSVDAAYIEFSSKRPTGAIEAEGVVVHMAGKNQIAGIEILSASTRFPIRTLRTLRVAS